MNALDIQTVEAMRVLGGAFVHALALACERADAENLARIKSAFPELWARYEATGKLRGTQHPGKAEADPAPLDTTSGRGGRVPRDYGNGDA